MEIPFGEATKIAVQSYYNSLNNGEYIDAWLMLSESYRKIVNGNNFDKDGSTSYHKFKLMYDTKNNKWIINFVEPFTG